MVMLTLHHGPPQPLPAGVLIGVCIVNIVEPATGEARLRVLLLPVRECVALPPLTGCELLLPVRECRPPPPDRRYTKASRGG